jgi:cytoskeletal protein CcmA (bactofilin family)
MFFNSNNKTSLISAGTKLSGSLTFNDHLEVEGEIHGNIEADTASQSSGRVDGDIHAVGHLELAAGANVTGNLYYHSMEMVKGAVIAGNLVQIEVKDTANVVAINKSNT